MVHDPRYARAPDLRTQALAVVMLAGHTPWKKIVTRAAYMLTSEMPMVEIIEKLKAEFPKTIKPPLVTTRRLSAVPPGHPNFTKATTTATIKLAAAKR